MTPRAGFARPARAPRNAWHSEEPATSTSPTTAPTISPIRWRVWLFGDIDGRRASEIANRYVSGFLGQAVTGRTDPLLDGSDRPYPEVDFQCGFS